MRKPNTAKSSKKAAHGQRRVMQYLEQSVAAYRAALKVYTPEQLPQDWATAQNNLGHRAQ